MRPKVGDVVELRARSGFIYAQYVNKEKMFGHLVRVFPGVFDSPPSSFSDVVQGKEQFLAFFPLGAAIRRGLVRVVANEQVPTEYKDFPTFKAGWKDPRTGQVSNWWLWDGEREWRVGYLSEEEKRKYPSREAINDTLLIERVESNWQPE